MRTTDLLQRVCTGPSMLQQAAAGVCKGGHGVLQPSSCMWPGHEILQGCRQQARMRVQEGTTASLLCRSSLVREVSKETACRCELHNAVHAIWAVTSARIGKHAFCMRLLQEQMHHMLQHKCSLPASQEACACSM